MREQERGQTTMSEISEKENRKEKRNRILGIILFILGTGVFIWPLMQLESCEGCGRKQDQFAKVEVETTQEASGEDLTDESQEETKKPSVLVKEDQTADVEETLPPGEEIEEVTTGKTNESTATMQNSSSASQGNKPATSQQPNNSANNSSQPSSNPSTQPSQSTQPSNPSQPTKPTNSTQPTNPTQPTKPTNPTQPTKPTKPTNPTQPTKPTTPSRPTDPTDSTEEIIKKDPAYTVPKVNAIYGDTLGEIKLPKGYAWEQPLSTRVGDAGNNTSFTATYTPDDTVHFNTVKGIKVSMTVEKATPSYTVPKGLTATFGQKQGDVAAQLVGTRFSVENPSTEVGNAGSRTITLTYTPSDQRNFKTVSGITVPLQVAKAPKVITGVSLPDASYPYNPSRSYSISITGTLPDGVTVAYEGNNRVNQGNWVVRAIFSCDENHELNITSMTGVMHIWDDVNNPGNGTLLQPEAPDVPGSSGVLTPGDSVGQG